MRKQSFDSAQDEDIQKTGENKEKVKVKSAGNVTTPVL